MRQEYIRKTRSLNALSIVLILGMCITFLTTSCDSHEAVDYNLHIGYVLCSDHSCISYDEYKGLEPGTKEPVGVVFAETNDQHPNLVVSLKEYEDAFCDTLGLENGTSCRLDSCDGYSNTVAMYGSYVKETGKGCPIAMRCFASHYFGQSQYIPSVMEMRLLVAATPYINGIIEDLGGTPIKTTGDCWYWTSTEVEGNVPNQAWLCSAAPNAGIQETPKGEVHLARPILQLNYPTNKERE